MTERYLKSVRVNVRDRARVFESSSPAPPTASAATTATVVGASRTSPGTNGGTGTAGVAAKEPPKRTVGRLNLPGLKPVVKTGPAVEKTADAVSPAASSNGSVAPKEATVPEVAPKVDDDVSSVKNAASVTVCANSAAPAVAPPEVRAEELPNAKPALPLVPEVSATDGVVAKPKKMVKVRRVRPKVAKTGDEPEVKPEAARETSEPAVVAGPTSAEKPESPAAAKPEADQLNKVTIKGKVYTVVTEVDNVDTDVAESKMESDEHKDMVLAAEEPKTPLLETPEVVRRASIAGDEIPVPPRNTVELIEQFNRLTGAAPVPAATPVAPGTPGTVRPSRPRSLHRKSASLDSLGLAELTSGSTWPPEDELPSPTRSRSGRSGRGRLDAAGSQAYHRYVGSMMQPNRGETGTPPSGGRANLEDPELQIAELLSSVQKIRAEFEQQQHQQNVKAPSVTNGDTPSVHRQDVPRHSVTFSTSSSSGSSEEALDGTATVAPPRSADDNDDARRKKLAAASFPPSSSSSSSSSSSCTADRPKQKVKNNGVRAPPVSTRDDDDDISGDAPSSPPTAAAARQTRSSDETDRLNAALRGGRRRLDSAEEYGADDHDWCPLAAPQHRHRQQQRGSSNCVRFRDDSAPPLNGGRADETPDYLRSDSESSGECNQDGGGERRIGAVRFSTNPVRPSPFDDDVTDRIINNTNSGSNLLIRSAADDDRNNNRNRNCFGFGQTTHVQSIHVPPGDFYQLSASPAPPRGGARKARKDYDKIVADLTLGCREPETEDAKPEVEPHHQQQQQEEEEERLRQCFRRAGGSPRVIPVRERPRRRPEVTAEPGSDEECRPRDGYRQRKSGVSPRPNRAAARNSRGVDDNADLATLAERRVHQQQQQQRPLPALWRTLDHGASRTGADDSGSTYSPRPYFDSAADDGGDRHCGVTSLGPFDDDDDGGGVGMERRLSPLAPSPPAVSPSDTRLRRFGSGPSLVLRNSNAAGPFTGPADPSRAQHFSFPQSEQYAKPLSPTGKAQVRPRPELPSYFTVRRRPALRKVSSDPHSGHRHDSGALSDGGKAELDNIESILGELDFSKFRRGATVASGPSDTLGGASGWTSSIPRHCPGAHQKLSPQASATGSEQPRPYDTPPASPRARQQDEKLRELRELTEKLMPAIHRARRDTNLRGVEPTQSTAYRSRSLPRGRHQPVFRTSSVPQVDDDYDEGYEWPPPPPPPSSASPVASRGRSTATSGGGSSNFVSAIATLPRVRMAEQRDVPASHSSSTGTGAASDQTQEMVRQLRSAVSSLSLDSASDMVMDEGLAMEDSASAPSYDQTYRQVHTSSASAPATPGPYHKPIAAGPVHGFDSQVQDALAELQGVGISGAGLQYSSLDRRKMRHKGAGLSVGFSSGGTEEGIGGAVAKPTARSRTFPPQRRGSVSEELDFTSVDSNGLRSYAPAQPVAAAALHLQPPHRPHFPSEVSLADSHLCPSEGGSYEASTYGDVLDSVTAHHLSAPSSNAEEHLTAGGNGKPLKKKHYSDPSGEKNNEGLLDLPELISSARSEPRLPVAGGGGGVAASATSCSSLGMTGSHGPRTPSPARSPLVTSSVSFDSAGSVSRSPQQQRRYSKKKLRGPYGEMLEEEMRKSGENKQLQKLVIAEELSFLKELGEGHQASQPPPSSQHHRSGTPTSPPATSDVRHMSSQSLDENALRAATYHREADTQSPPPSAPVFRPPFAVAGSKETDQIQWSLYGESEDMDSLLKRHQDTRTHVVAELYDTEKSYVESLQILINKYFRPLKSQEYSGLVDASLVDEMFFQIPEILAHHESFLEVLKQRLENWDNKQKVGDVFVESFTKQLVIDTYTAFINNWKAAKEAIKIASHAKPAFAKFLEHMSREHKGKLTLDALLIMPVQRIPRYELLIKELLKHTQVDHPDHRLLVIAQKEVHDLAVKINHMEREAYEMEQIQLKLREMEALIEGLVDLVHPQRAFLRYDLVTMSGSLGAKKERCLFLFSDLLLITNIKRKSGTIRKTSTMGSPGSLSNTLDMNKYKLLMRISLDDLDVARNNDTNMKNILKDIQQLEEDTTVLGQITDLTAGLHCNHQNLDDVLKEMMSSVTKQLQEKQTSDSELLCLELTVTTQVGMETMSIIFSAPDKRASWEATFHEAKQKLALSTDRRPPPEFMYPLPIRKTRAGLQFTCSTPTIGLNSHNLRDVWVCNSDGYVGQVCVLSLQPDPTITSCNGVCNARILCITSIPAAFPGITEGFYGGLHRRSAFMDSKAGVSISIEDVDEEEELCGSAGGGGSSATTGNGNIQLDSDSSEEEKEPASDDEESGRSKSDLFNDESKQDEVDNQQPTMWLGTEDGCIHVYNCNDNIRIKKNKVKLQHPAAIHCIIYLEAKVFVSLSNGDLIVYHRDPNGGWNTCEPSTLTIGSSVTPITRMLAVTGKLWCGCQNMVKIIDTISFEIEHSFAVHVDANRVIQCMVTSGLGVWISVQNSSVVKLYHATSYDCLLDVNMAPAVSKMLAAGCDDIIRQHKAACLRVTSLLACKDLLWVGTSAGVILNLALPHLTSSTGKLSSTPNVSGLFHGHTGHVRFLTCVEMTPSPQDGTGRNKYTHRSLKYKDGLAVNRRASTSALGSNRLLIISGGDGYEDFRNTNYSEAAGRDDSTNHLLLWQV